MTKLKMITLNDGRVGRVWNQCRRSTKKVMKNCNLSLLEKFINFMIDFYFDVVGRIFHLASLCVFCYCSIFFRLTRIFFRGNKFNSILNHFKIRIVLLKSEFYSRHRGFSKVVLLCTRFVHC